MSDKVREEFEIWAKEFGFPASRYGEGYSLPATNYAWSAWQASRQALVVELPEVWEDGYDTLMDAEMVKKSIDNAGIKWTE